jgi:phage terminase large subunit
MTDIISRDSLGGFRVLRTEITHNSGGMIYFRGLARNPHSVKSSEGINIVWVEEAHAVSEESWRQLIPTIRADNSEIWISYNPRYLDDPTCRRFYGDNAPAGAIVCEVNHDANPHFPPALRSEMALDYARDPELAEHIWGGKPLQFSNAQVLKGKWVVDTVNDLKSWIGPFFGVDFGITDPTAAVECWYRDGVLYIKNELYARTVDNMPAFLSNMPGLKQNPSYADSAWPETIQTLRRAGFDRMHPAKKWAGSVDDGVLWLRGLQRIIINPACRNAIDEASAWRWKTDLQGNPLAALQPGSDHCWDAVRYGMGGQIQQRSKGAVSYV